MARKDQVKLFLMLLRDCLSRKFFIVPRDKNLQAIADLNLTPAQVKIIVRHLTLENYVDGPLLDIDRKEGDIWIFGANVNEVECYVKLKMYEVNEKRYVKCISFHAAEEEIVYPFRQRG